MDKPQLHDGCVRGKCHGESRDVRVSHGMELEAVVSPSKNEKSLRALQRATYSSEVRAGSFDVIRGRMAPLTAAHVSGLRVAAMVRVVRRVS